MYDKGSRNQRSLSEATVEALKQKHTDLGILPSEFIRRAVAEALKKEEEKQ